MDMRNYTSIDHRALDSDTLANATDAQEAIWWRLLCIADDWGRFPKNAKKVKRMMRDFRHTIEEIDEAIKYFVKSESIVTYKIDGVDCCQWVNWDKYQNMKWKNKAQYPNDKGKYEGSTNPATKQKRTQAGTYAETDADTDAEAEAVANPILSHPNQPHLKDSAPGDAGIAKGNEAVKRWTDIMRELRDPNYRPNKPAIGNINNAFKFLKNDIAEFETRARNYLGSDFVKMPTPAKFYASIENYKDGVYDDGWSDKGG